MDSSLIKLEQKGCRVYFPIIISIFCPIDRCESTKSLLILLAFCNKESRSFVFALFVELVHWKVIFWSSKYSFEFKASIIEAFFKEVWVLLKINELWIPIWYIDWNWLLGWRLLNHYLGFFYDPITIYGSDICPEVAQRGHVFDKRDELIGFNLKFFVLIKKYIFYDTHDLLLEGMKFSKRILKEGTYGFVNDFFAISNMVWVFLNHA